AGTAIAARSVAPRIRLFGAEPTAGDDTVQSLAAGRRIAIPPPDTIADGARTESPGALTFPILQRDVEAVVRLPDEALVRTMADLLGTMKLLVEPTGALAAAAAFEGLLPPDVRRVGIILSGGNVDLETLAALLAGVSR
ncbi:MAG: pyridoxal-phosphate dependent enzyme, partial [Gemmatimonadota bacterium]